MKYAGNKKSARIVTLSDLGTHTHKTKILPITRMIKYKRKQKVIKRKEITLDALAAD